MKSHRLLFASLFVTILLIPASTPGQSTQTDPSKAQGQGKEPELTEIQYLEIWFDARRRGDIRSAFEAGKAYVARYPKGTLVEEFRNWVKKVIEILDSRRPPLEVHTKENSSAQPAQEADRDDPLLETLLNDLIEQNAYEEVRLSSGRTLLMLAASNGNSERVKNLLRKGVHVNWVDATRNWTALFYAIRKGKPEIVQALIDSGAAVTIKDKEGRDAIDYAKQMGNSEIIRIVQGSGRR